MNSERNPHLSDPSSGGCVIGSSSGGPIHGYGSPPGNHGGADMVVGQPCPVPTPPWVKPPSNNGNSGMMTPESDVSSCSSPASNSYGASSTTQQFPPQQQHLSTHHHLQQQHHQRSFYGSANYNSCGDVNNSNSSSNDPAGAHTTLNQIRANHNSYCNTTANNNNTISSSTNNGMFYDSVEVIDQSQYYHHHHQQQQHQHHHPNHNSHNHHHHHHNHHFHHQAQFDNNMHLQKTGSSNSSCASLESTTTVNMSGERAGDDGGGTTFYGFYNQSGQYTDYHQHHHHNQHHEYPPATSTDSTSNGGNRVHHQQYYRQDGSSTNTSANSVPVGHQNYFSGNVSPQTANYPSSPAGVVSGTSTPPAIMPTRYGSPMVFPNNHGHQQLSSAGNTNNSGGYGSQQHANPHGQLGQIPLRRNSIESYSSEPGDMHSSYSARYGCNNTSNNMNHQHLQQISNHGHHSNNPFSTNNSGSTGNNSSGMIKRECMSTGSNTGMTSRSPPSMNTTMTSSRKPNVPTTWSSSHAPPGGGGATVGYFSSPSPNSNCTSSSPNPCSSNATTTSCASYISNAYDRSSTCGSESSDCANNAAPSPGNFYPNHPHHHHTSQFKSCAYEESQQHHDIKEGIPSLVGSTNNAGVNSNSMNKAASAVKHRSLSLSMPLPSYLESSGSSRSDSVENNFVNHAHHHHRQFQHHSNSSEPHHHHGFNPMLDNSQQCSTSGLVQPDQNLLTPNSDDDMPFRTASAGGQSDLDSSYETMGDEGCSSSTSASHCMSINTSVNSTCSGSSTCENNSQVMTTSDLHPMTVNTNDPVDCQHHHHHHHHHPHSDISYTNTSPSVSSCMQSHHPPTMSMGMLEIPNSTVALCTNNDVDDLDDSSSDSSDELHNVISAVVENSSIETPENTMMGDEIDENDVDHGEDAAERDHDDDPSESTSATSGGITTNRTQHHHPTTTIDNQADVNVISTTTNEADEVDGEDEVADDNDNCSESSMSNINSSFTADMFNSNSNSADNTINTSDNKTNKADINMSCDTFPCIPEEGNFADDDDDDHELEDDEDNVRQASVNSSLSLQVLNKSSSNNNTPLSTSDNIVSSLSPQKIAKRSFSETDKDHAIINTTTSTPTTLALGASFRKGFGGSGGSGNGTSSHSLSADSVQNNDGCSSNNSDTNGGSANVDVNSDNKSGNSTSSNTPSSGCKAIDIIISSSGRNGTDVISLSENGSSRVSIPKGWKREILKGSLPDNGTNGNGVLYISPSDTKIRNLDELKNYIGSDGTCKCGLSCPLRLEVAFSFDPKVTNMTVEDEKENFELRSAARNDTSTSSSSSSASATTLCITATGESDARLLCNHKRKIPKAEDSPLISSTRDDLGDFGEKLKKRRLSGNECLGEKLVSSGPFRKDPITTTSLSANKSSSNTGGSGSHNVPVPFCQQSPDTTTQTPQTDMSPASSVCSESSTILFSSAGGSGSGGGNRSLTSTPTPTLSSSTTSSSSSALIGAPAATTSKIGSSPSQGQGHQGQFVWPSPPTLTPTTNLSSGSSTQQQHQLAQNQSNTFWLNPPNSSTTFSTNPVGSISGSSNSNNSLTLNYVQSPTTTGSCTSSVTVNTSSTAAIMTTGGSSSNAQITITTTGNSSSPTTLSTSTISSNASTNANSTTKKAYHPYPLKNVKRPSSPCPNIDVRQLPLEQNRPPPLPVTSNAPKMPSLGCTTSLSNLPLPIVSNSNILLTVTPPQLVTTNKTEIVSLSTPTLPILPLLTTGKLPTVASIDSTPTTIVTTLQPNASILGTIDPTTLYTIPKETPVVPAKPVATTTAVVPVVQQQLLTPKVEGGGSADVVRNNAARGQISKSNETGNSKSDKVSSGLKTQGKVGRDGKSLVTQSTGVSTGEKSPLQLAQDIVDRFEKKSGEKNSEIASGNASSNDNGNTPNPSPSKESLPEEKVKEKSGANKVVKPKDGNSKTEKSNDVVAVTKSIIDSSSVEPKADNGKSEDATKTAVKERATTDVTQVDDKSKVLVDTSTKLPATITSITPLITTPVNTLVPTAQLPPQQQLSDTIITSQTPVMSTTPLIFKDGLHLTTDQGLTLTTSVSAPIPTISLSAVGNQLIQTSGAPVSCSSTLTAGSLGTFATAGTNQIILQPSHQISDQTNGANSTFLTTSAGPGTGPLRYPILQTIQPLFLNSAGPAGGPLIISQPQSQDPSQGNPLAQQSFIYDQNGTPTATIDGVGTFQSMLQPTTTTMVLDPSICAGNPNLVGGKKKKKRLSKKQQQQQAQLQLQQQLILQQIQQQQQAAAAAATTFPLTIFPQSFNLGPQGFSLQPTMNFFPTPTILTLPNLILNPADGTLFIQPSTPLPTATTTHQMQPTMKLGQFPLTTTTSVPQNPQIIAPKKDGNVTTLQNLNEPIKPATTPGLDPGSDDSRQNPTPDSSTNDLQLGLINVATGPPQQTNTITLNIPAAPTTTTVLHNPSPVGNKKNSKSRTVSSSSTTVKRILPQKQILPKIDSTTPSTTENAN